jgi:hypothetical protein
MERKNVSADCFVIGLLDFWCLKLARWISGDKGKIKRWRPINREAFLALMRDRNARPSK